MFKNKYLKYKSKYLELKNKLSGGSQGGVSKQKIYAEKKKAEQKRRDELREEAEQKRRDELREEPKATGKATKEPVKKDEKEESVKEADERAHAWLQRNRGEEERRQIGVRDREIERREEELRGMKEEKREKEGKGEKEKRTEVKNREKKERRGERKAEREAEVEAARKAEREAEKEAVRKANRAYQATRLYANPPVFGERDERRETNDYGLAHLARTITKIPILHNMASFLGAEDLGQLVQTRKVIGTKLEQDAKERAKVIHQLCFSRIPFESMIKEHSKVAVSLQELVNDKSHKILLMGNRYSGKKRVYMMIINDGNVEWKRCASMKNIQEYRSAYYYQGQVMTVGKYYHYDQEFCGLRDSSERYDVLSQTAVELEPKLPNPYLCHVAMAELDGKAFAIGGSNSAMVNIMYTSDRVFCLDMNPVQAGAWIEQEARLITARYYAAAATHQGKVWLAGGRNGNNEWLSSIEVFDPSVGSWQAAGNLTVVRYYNFALFAINDDLFAAGGGSSYESMWVEKRDGQSGAWQLVSELNENDGSRDGCALAACGSTIYFIGGERNMIWNSFDTRTSTWASQQGPYQDIATRVLPRDFCDSQAVCITPDEQLAVLAKYARHPPSPEP